MIAIHKSDIIPKSLTGLRKPRTPKSALRNHSYANPDVKAQLLADQHDKCAYCDCLLNGDFGHVEHFRPKGGFVCAADSRLRQPGYFWLANCWDNLLLSCSRCNTSFKRNQFDLLHENARNIALRDISREQPLLISPVDDNPELLFAYDKYLIKPRSQGDDNELRARYTIDLLQLNSRPELVSHRRNVYIAFRKWLAIQRLSESSLARQRFMLSLWLKALFTDSRLRFMMTDKAEYAGMTRYTFSHHYLNSAIT